MNLSLFVKKVSKKFDIIILFCKPYGKVIDYIYVIYKSTVYKLNNIMKHLSRKCLIYSSRNSD